MNCSSYKNRALQEAQEIFGVDFDPEEFEDFGPEEEEDFDDDVSSCVRSSYIIVKHLMALNIS